MAGTTRAIRCRNGTFYDGTAAGNSAGENLLAVRVDNRVNPAIPPDGVEMDFLLGGGLYRDVFLHVSDRLHLTFPWEGREAGVRLTLPELTETAAVVGLDATVRNESATNRHCVLLGEIRDKAGNVVAAVRQEAAVDAGQEFTFQQRTQPISNPHLWSPDNPYLYQVSTRVLEGDRQLDAATTPLGLRWVRFDRERGFFLNGKALKLVGVNRHETWPFIGHAVPNSLHRFDAEQIKAAGFNWVRLSHYPQDPDFLCALDELGLMALAEPPSWMNRGSALWMTNLVQSFRSMIRRDRNHPCIIAWNACINHQTSHPALVRAALEEDPTRERGQDTLATPMNFHPGQISGDGALAVEHTGHTFPAPRGGRAIPVRPPGAGQIDGDTRVNREFEQAQRHWQQVDAAYRKPDNSGLAVWCMYDYNTFHNVNEPGIVWHGVCDLFRLPKYSFWWHQSELSPEPMVYLVRVDARHAAVFSNCEKIELWEGDGTTERAVVSAPTLLSRTLHHPPRLYSISTNAVRLRALGLNGDVAKASNQWNQASAPCGLDLVSDRLRLVADGADLTRLVVRVVDVQGTTVENSDCQVTFTISGRGQLIGENPAPTRAGQAIILAQAGFVPGTMTVVATTKQLASATITIETQPVPPTVNLPVDLPDQPTLRILGPPGRLRSK